ncbi:secreted protein [methanotrophic bacterial endosymbiont of Bathymodiolus sp.]|nr:secreted protein [methanotrophic bacterial endosymbiont of Bathymodiolus sp.]
MVLTKTITLLFFIVIAMSVVLATVVPGGRMTEQQD